MNNTECLRKAELLINSILAQLERDIGETVESVELVDLEVTQLGDEREQFLRRVRLTTKRPPGFRWVEAK